ncbi:MAG: hypothetical protein U1F66_10370 [bacterium]
MDTDFEMLQSLLEEAAAQMPEPEFFEAYSEFQEATPCSALAGLQNARQAYCSEWQRKLDMTELSSENFLRVPQHHNEFFVGSLQYQDGLKGKLSFFKGFC